MMPDTVKKYKKSIDNLKDDKALAAHILLSAAFDIDVTIEDQEEISAYFKQTFKEGKEDE